MKITRLWAVMLAIALFASTGSYAQKKKSPAKGATQKTTQAAKTVPAGESQIPTKITEVEGISEYMLPNGLEVLLFPDPSKAKMTVNVTYLVGSRMEGYGETGMAHLLEHMLFKGSLNHPKTDDELTTHGADNNGSTYYDRTNYFETFAASDENLEWALSLEADRMVNSFIAEKDLKSEFTVVRNEFEMDEDNAASILRERIMSTAYLWHNYGKSPIGSKEDIERVPIKSLQAFYKKYYQPDNAVLLVAGKIDEQKTLKLINKYFGAIPRPTRVIDPTYTVEPVQDGERFVELRRVGDLQSVGCAYHITAGSDPSYASFDVLSDILTNQPNGRLYQSLVKSGVATEVYSDAMALKDPGMLYIGADVLKDRSLDSAKDIMLSTLSELRKTPVTQDEVDKAKAHLLKNFEEVYRNTEYVGIQMSEMIAQGDWRLGFIYRDNLKKVTADDVNKIIKEYLLKSNRTVGVFIPTANPKRAQIPESPDVAKMVKDYKGQAALSQAEAFDATPDNIEKRTERGQLPGGAKYALLSKTTRGNTVDAVITLRMGDDKSLRNKAVIASLTASMLKRGTKDKTMAQINETLDKLSSSIFVGASKQDVYLYIKSTRQNLPQVLDLIDDMLHQPAFTEDEFKALKAENLSNLEQEKSEPQSLAFREYSHIMTPRTKGDVDYVMSADEEIDAVNKATLADVKDYYKDFYNSEHATTSFVGDFDAGVVKTKLNKILANWSSPEKYTRIKEKYDDVKSENKELKTPDKKNAMYVAGMNLKLRDDNPDYPALNMGDFMFGGGFLSSRLAMRIRQKEGISYGVGSFLQAGAQDESGAFISYAIYNPENKARLETAWNEELARMLKDGFTADELKQAKSGLLQYRQNNRADDQALAGKLNNYLEINRTMAWDKAMDEKLTNLKLADINSAMKKYLDPGKIVYVKAGDFK